MNLPEPMPHNGSRITCESALKRFGDSTRAGASRHEPPYAEAEGRSVEGGEARDGLVQARPLHSLVMRRAFHSFNPRRHRSKSRAPWRNAITVTRSDPTR